MFNKIKCFLIKEWKIEYEKSYVFWSILLYIISTVFLIYITLGKPDDFIWNALFWITQIFVCINAVSKSFLTEHLKSLNFYYFLISPQEFILSKIIYNIIFSIIFVSITFMFFLFFLGIPEIKLLPYWLLSIFSVIGFSNTFTFLSAIASKAKQNSSFVAILGFPLIIPQIMLIDKLTSTIFSNDYSKTFFITICLLILLDVITVILSIILFPFLWKD